MVQIIRNPYQPQPSMGDTFKAGISSLAAPFLDSMTPELKLQHIYALQQQVAKERMANEGVQGLANLAGSGGNLLGNDANRYGILAGKDAKFGGGYARTAALDSGAPLTGDVVTRSGLAAGDDYRTLPQGVAMAEANKMAIQQAQERTRLAIEGQKPTTVIQNGVPTFVRQDQSYGQPASVGLGEQQGAFASQNMGRLEDLKPNEQKFIGAYVPDDKTQNWVDKGPNGVILRGRTLDGKTDATTGQPLSATAQLVSTGNPGGSTGFTDPNDINASQKAQLQNQVTANQELINLTGQMRNLVTQNKSIVGPTGVVQKVAQNAADVVNNVSQLFGGAQGVNAQASNIKNQLLAIAARSGVDPTTILPGLFNPHVSQMEALHAIMVYKGAQALFGQSGRDLSDKDLKQANALFGDPLSLLSGPQQLLSKLDTVEAIARANAERYGSMVQTNQYGAGAGVPALRAGAPSTADAPATATPQQPAGPRTINTSRGAVTIQRVE